MAKAGDQYEFRTGNIWNFANRDDVVTVKRLVSEGVPATLANKVGWTPLHAAAFGGAERVISFLLREAVDVEARCKAGRTPLMDAARSGHLGAVKALVKSGGSLHATDSSGLGVIEHAKGDSLRAWILQRVSPEPACVEQARGRGTRRDEPVGHGKSSGKSEARAEHQKIGASSKQKAARLKAKRSEAQASAREMAARARKASATEAPKRDEGLGAPADRSGLAERATKDGHANDHRASDARVSDGHASDGRGSDGCATDERASYEQSGLALCFGASVEERRRFAYAPLALGVSGTLDALGRPSIVPGASHALCLAGAPLDKAALETAASFAAPPSASP